MAGATDHWASAERPPEEDWKRDIRLVEELAANAWPPHTSQSLGPWRLRATFGVTMRANSVWAVGETPEGDWLGAAESFYRRRGLPVCFVVGDASPSGVDAALAERGYEMMYPCFFMAGAAAETIGHVPPDGRFQTRHAEDADDAWIDDFIRIEGFPPSRAPAYRHIFRAIGPVKTFARLTDENGETVAFGTAVAERGWAGVSNIVVAPAHRRRGAAAQLMRALAVWAERQGASRLWLQVMENNEPALRLYGKLGFAPLSRFHYRVKRTCGPDSGCQGC